MTEQQQSSEIQQSISGVQVEQHLRAFTAQSEEGFTSEADSLRAYAGLIDITSRFFQQREVRKKGSPQESQAKDVLAKLFYNHGQDQPFQIGFFEDARTQVRAGVLASSGEPPMRGKLQDEIRVFGQLLTQESVRANRSLQDELHAAHELTELVSEAPEDDTTTIEAAAERTSEINDAVLQIAEQDQVGGPEVQRIRSFQNAVQELAADETPITADRITAALGDYRMYLGEEAGRDPYGNLVARAGMGHERYVRRQITELSEKVSGSDYVWKQAVSIGLIPGELFHAYEEVQTMAELQDVMVQLQDQPDAVKAVHLQPFIDRGVSASLLFELAKGRFEMPDEMVIQQVETFLALHTDYQVEVTDTRGKRFGRTRKAVAGVLAASILAMPMVSATSAISDRLAEEFAVETVDDLKDDINTVDRNDIYAERKKEAPLVEQGPTINSLKQVLDGTFAGIVDYPVLPNDGYIKFLDRYLDTEYSYSWDRGDVVSRMLVDFAEINGTELPMLHPNEFVSPDTFLDSLTDDQIRVIVDTLQSPTIEDYTQNVAPMVESVKDGNPLPPLASAEEYQGSTSLGSPREQKPDMASPEAFLNGVGMELWQLEGDRGYFSGHYRTGTASDYDPQRLSWKVEKYTSERPNPIVTDRTDVRFTGTHTITSEIVDLPVKADFAVNEESIFITGDVSYDLRQAADGTYYLQVRPEDVGKEVTIRFATGLSEYATVPLPTQEQLAMMSESYMPIDQLPNTELKYVMEELSQRQDIEPGIKLKMLENYISEHFLYSLDPSVADEYRAQGTARDYFAKIAELGRGDCDVINGLAIMMLRELNIPARLVLGNAHEYGLLVADIASMTAVTQHGWVEVYDGAKWITFDATPITFDDYTKESLQNQMTGEGGLPGENEGDSGEGSSDGADQEPDLDAEEAKNRLDELLENDESREEDRRNSEELRQKYSNDPAGLLEVGLGLVGLYLASGAVGHFVRKGNEKMAAQFQDIMSNRYYKYVDNERMPTDVRQALNRLLPEIPYGTPYEGLKGGKKARLLNTIGDGLSSLFQRRRLRKSIYARPEPTEEIQQTTEPNAVDFQVAMGEPRESAERSVHDAEYKRTLYDLSNGMKNLVYDIANHSADKTSYRAHLRGMLASLQEPQTAEAFANWPDTIARIQDHLYDQLTRTHKAKLRKGRLIVGRGVRQLQSPVISRDAFDAKMQDLIRLKLTEWTVNGSR